MTAYKTREIGSVIRRALAEMPVVVLTGMRQTGKSTLLQQDPRFKGYEQTYLQRDLREATAISDVLGFRNVLKLAALRSGQILNASDLGRDSKLNSVTVTRWKRATI